MKIYVGNLSYEVTEEDLRLAFEEFGQIESANIIKDKYSGESKGFGFVEMSSKAEGQSAIDGLNGKEFKGMAKAGIVAKAGIAAKADMVVKADMVEAEEDAGGTDEAMQTIVLNNRHTTDKTIII
jgi:hypothetical protein